MELLPTSPLAGQAMSSGRDLASRIRSYQPEVSASESSTPNQPEVCLEDSAYQVSKPFTSFTRPTDQYLRCTLRLKTSGRWRTWRNRKGGITGGLRDHLEADHGPTFYAKRRAEGLQPRNSTTTHSEPTEEFTLDGLREYIARWAAIDDQAMSAVDRKKDIPRRQKVTKAVNDLYLAERSKIIEKMKNARGLISITSDLWSDINIRAFMAVTAHYINEDGFLAEHLIAFRLIHGSHTGTNLGFVTLDNAANNDTLMRELEASFRAQDITSFGQVSNRIRCFPHVINLVVRAILDALSSAAHEYRAAATAQGVVLDSLTEDYLAALESKPVEKLRSSVNAMRASGTRREGLQETIREGNFYNLFVNELGEAIEVPQLQLLRDCETRWSSTYNMICRYITLNPAIVHYGIRHPSANIPVVSCKQLEVLKDICSVLSILHNAQELLSAERTPTVALALPVYETLLHTLSQIRSTFPELSFAITRGIEKLDSYINKTHSIPVYALAMAVNPCFKLNWINHHWDAPAREQAYAAVHAQMLQYAQEQPATATLDVHSQAQAAAQALGSGYARLLMGGLTITRASNPLGQPEDNPYITTPTHVPFNPAAAELPPQDPMVQVELELARWIAQGTLGTQDMGTIELVQYWRAHQYEFPLLYRVAMDVLPAQASSVLSERAFSSSKLTCTRERSVILPENLERLQVLKHALQRRQACVGRAEQSLDFMEHIIRPTDESDDSDLSDVESTDGYEPN
ncbi:hAT family dimerization protein [Ceratobasidium sp. AG-Ba]|nr:hAT family dimerization protein [Ceratobasidium sp. AG-Ba]QRW13844.1 hAT family dimerization protein [Ceratobasidium sp. AG-Ba]